MHRAILSTAAVAALVAATPAHATFPGHNGRLVFQRPVGHQVDLFALRGTHVTRLTHTRTWEEKPEWSADGRHLTVALSRPSGEPTEVATLDADGRHPHALTDFGAISSAPTWSPAGALAYFGTEGVTPVGDGPPPAELFTLTDGRTGRLTHDRIIQTDPEWSPTGRTIAYSQWRAVHGQPGVFDIGLYAMRPDGTHPRPVLAPAAKRDIVTQDWSPDGTQLVLEIATGTPTGRTAGTRQSDIAVVNADGSGLRYLTRTPALESEPVWSPDGTRIAFASDRQVAHGAHLDRNGAAFELYTMAADGSDVRRLTHNHVPDLYPTWQAR